MFERSESGNLVLGDFPGEERIKTPPPLGLSQLSDSY